MTVSLNTDELKFDEVVGMLQSHEMEIDVPKKQKGIALVSNGKYDKVKEDDDAVGMLVRRFDRALRKVEKGQKRNVVTKRSSETEKSNKKSEVQCFECKGYGHFKSDCPTIKRREIQCFECKGFGHTQMECLNDQKKNKARSMMGINEDTTEEEEESEDEDISNFVSFIGFTEFKDDIETSDSESEEEEEIEINLQEEYKVMCSTLLRLSKEKQSLSKDKLNLQEKIDSLEKELRAEKENSTRLQSNLEEQTKTIRMLNTGTKQLNKILTMGRLEKTHVGLGYTGGEKAQVS